MGDKSKPECDWNAQTWLVAPDCYYSNRRIVAVTCDCIHSRAKPEKPQIGVSKQTSNSKQNALKDLEFHFHCFIAVTLF